MDRAELERDGDRASGSCDKRKRVSRAAPNGQNSLWQRPAKPGQTWPTDHIQLARGGILSALIVVLIDEY